MRSLPAAAVTDRACEQHLDRKYGELCRSLVDRLARMHPSPLGRGDPRIQAAGVVYTVGSINLLEQNPLAWLVSVNGIPVDARTLPSELQDEARRLGLISGLDTRMPA